MNTNGHAWQVPIMAADEQRMKALFAAQLARSLNDPYGAAARAFGNKPEDRAQNTYIATVWPTDPDVLKEVRRLFAEAENNPDLAPPREMVAAELYEYARALTDPEMKLKALRLYADIRGFIDKGGSKTNVNVNSTTNTINNVPVLVVPSHPSREAWERASIEQQRKLIEADK